MRFRALVAALLGMAYAASAMAADAWEEGTHYFRLSHAMPVSTPGKVEVLDIFSYACTACYAFEPTWNKIRAALPAKAKVAYLPAAFNTEEDWPVFQRAFLAAQALGISEKTHDAIYEAVWNTGQLAVVTPDRKKARPAEQQPTIKDLARIYALYGVTEERFLATATSFETDTKMRRADKLVRDYEIDSTPTLVVNGKFRATPASAGGYDKLIELVQYLVKRETVAK